MTSLETIAANDPMTGLQSEAGYALEVVGVYEDELTRKWAAEVCEQARRVAGRDAVRCALWDLDSLDGPSVLGNAVSAATQADVIVIALRAAKQVPIGLCVWIDGWLPRRNRGLGALAALIGAYESEVAEHGPAQEYLQSVARQGGLDFLVEERKLGLELSSLDPDNIIPLVAADPQLSGHAAWRNQEVHGLSHWRVNE